MADLFQVMGTIAVNYGDAVSGLSKVKTSAGNAADGLEEVDGAAGDAESSVSDAGSAADDADGKFSTWAVTLANLAAEAISAVISKCTELAKSIASLGIDTETAFAKLETIAGTENIDALTESINELSTQTGVSSAELADVAYNAISAGASAETAMETVEAATKLATAGFTDSSAALSVLSTAMNSYGDTAGTVTDISDSLIMVQNLGVTTVDELASNMGKAIATGSAYSVSLGNLESAYVSVTKAGISTAEGTTYINSMLNELGDSGSDVSAILQEETGKSFTELMEDGYSLADVLEILYASCGNDSTALMNLWSSAEAGKASNAIINQGLEAFNENLETITGSAGATEDAYATMADTTATKIEIMKAGFQSLGLEIFEKFQGPLNSAIEFVTDTVIPGLESFGSKVMSVIENTDFSGITDGLEKVKEALEPVVEAVSGGLSWAYENVLKPFGTWAIDEGIPTVLDKISTAISNVVSTVKEWAAENMDTIMDKASAAAEGLSTAIGWVTDHLDIILPIIKGVTAAITAYKVVTTAMTTATKISTAAQKAMNVVMNANPIAIVVALIAGLVAALVMLYNNNETVREAIDNAWSKIKEVVGAVVDWFQTNVQPIIETVFGAISSFFTDTFLPALSSVWEGIQSAVQVVIDFFQNTVAPIVEEVFGAISSFFNDTFLPIVSSVWETISAVVGEVLDFFLNSLLPGIQQVMSAVAGAFQSAWELIKTVWDIVAPFFEGIWNAIKNVFSMVASVLGGFFSTAWAVIKAVWGVVATFFETVWVAIKGVFMPAADTLLGYFKLAWTSIKAVWDVVVAFFTAIWNAIAGVFSVVKSVLSGNFSDAWEAIKSIFSGFASFFMTLWESVKTIFGAIGTFIIDTFSNAWEMVKGVFSGLGTFFSGILDTIINLFADVGTAVADTISGVIKGAINAVLNTAVGIINGFISAINVAIGIINAIPGVSIDKLEKLEAPQLAEGGVLEQGQVGILEGEGQEAVIPLEKNTGWIERTAGSLASILLPMLPQSGGFDLSDFEASGALEDITAAFKVSLTDALGDRLEEIRDLVADFCELADEYLPAIEQMQMVLDTGELVGKITPRVDRELGRLSVRKARGSA